MDYQENKVMEENQIQPLRLGNIEFRLAKSLGTKPRDYIDIVFWYPNSYYGRETEFVKTREWYTPKNNPGVYRVHESCFKNPESCYTVATLEIEEEPDVKICGIRAFELGPKDYADFVVLAKQAYQYSYQLWREQQNY